ncbi:hypothetical protein C0J52_05551 [Blattella germanica]|nr:hypothetical protein C0J52_05551 [Blattella germanica]
MRSNTRKLGLEVNVNKTKYMVKRRNASCNANEQLMTNEGIFEEIQKEIKHSLNSGNALQGLLSSQLL